MGVWASKIKIIFYKLNFIKKFDNLYIVLYNIKNIYTRSDL